MSIQSYLRLQIKYKQYSRNMALRCLDKNHHRAWYWSGQLIKIEQKMFKYRTRPWYNDFWNKVAEIAQN